MRQGPERGLAMAVDARVQLAIGRGAAVSKPRGWAERHRHAVSTIASSLSKRGFQPVSLISRSFDARRTGGSPGRCGPILWGTFRPDTRSTALITSKTE